MNKRDTNRWYTLLPELIAGLQIAASPFLIGAGMGMAAFYLIDMPWNIGVCLLVSLSGLMTGLWWAVRIWKKEGTVHFMSRIIGSPELDQKYSDDPPF